MNNITLPSARTLISNGWKYVKDRSDLVILMSLPLFVFTVSDYLLESVSAVMDVKYMPLLVILNIVALIFNFLILGATLFSVARDGEQRVSIKEGLDWSKSNILKIVWIYILTFLVVLGGFTLLIIPGIMASLYIYFAQYVYINEGIKGMDALRRSHDLVKDNWWKIFITLLKVIVILFVIFFIIGFVSAIVANSVGESHSLTLLALLVMQVLSSTVTLLGFHIANDLYLNLVQIKAIQTTEQTSVPKWKYTLLLILGALILAGLIGLVSLGVSESLDEESIFTEEGIVEVDAKANIRELRLEGLDEDF